MSTPAGWYPDPEAQGQQRYWDGEAWTEHRAPLAQPQPPSAYPSAFPTAKQKKPFWRRTWVLVTAGVIVVLGVIIGASASNGPTNASANGDKTHTPHNHNVAATTPKAAPSAKATHSAPQPPIPTKASKPKPTKSTPSYTVAQQQAIEAAQTYLSMGTGFSRAGLIQQLSSKYGDGFSVADATFAVDHIKVSWNQQAVESAKTYLQMGGFSRASLVQQLSSKYGDGFTLAQATYAANHVGL